MALNVNYVLRETGINLKRNLTLTVATILTVVVSLTLAGGALLIRQGVDNATARWKGGIELIVFMNADAPPGQIASMRGTLESSAEVKDFRYLDHDDAFEEFQDLFEDTPEVAESVTDPNILPTSFKVVPADPSVASVGGLQQVFSTQPGVLEVVSANDTIKAMEAVTRVVSVMVFGAALALLGTAALLIFNTIRTAMFARRREIEVMKLVGATNWFIRVPFMLEGLIQGVVGAGLAVIVLNFLQNLITDVFDRPGIALFNEFLSGSENLVPASLFILAVGLVVGVLGSGIAAGRYLDV